MKLKTHKLFTTEKFLSDGIFDSEYYDLDLISYSLLSRLRTHPSKVHEDREFGDGVRLGSALDTLIFDGTPAFKEKFYVMESSRPTGKTGEVLEVVANQINQREHELKLLEQNIEKSGNDGAAIEEYKDALKLYKFKFPGNCTPSDAAQAVIDLNAAFEAVYILVLEACNAVGYQSNWKDDTRVKKIVEEGYNYLTELSVINGRELLSSDEYDQIKSASMVLKTHPWTAQFFNVISGFDHYFQVPVFSNYTADTVKVGVKSLADILIVSNEHKFIVPADLKTTGTHIDNFPYEFIRWKYYLQASLYMYGLKEAVEGRGVIINPDTGEPINVEGYEIKPFRFVVESMINIPHPYKYRVTEKDLYVGEYGGIINGRKISGFRELIDDYFWHEQTNKWDYRKAQYDAEGELPLDVFDFLNDLETDVAGNLL